MEEDIMRRWMKRGILFVLTFTIIYFGIYGFKLYRDLQNQKVFYEVFDEENWTNPLDNIGLAEDLDIYKDDEELQLHNIYVTVFKPRNNNDKNSYNFEELIKFSGENELKKSKLEIFFEDENKNILKNQIFIKEPNATIEIRGRSSRRALQKSFKIRLFDRKGLWHNQNIINLNKHYFDPLRIRNKLSFDYLKIIPNITSLRTRFVRLFVKDLSTDSPDETFRDYGFFTQVEQPNTLFLKNRGLDPNAHLYKVEDFKFLRYPDNIKNKQDEGFSRKSFEEILEIRGEEDHEKLINMLNDVNDYSKDINEVFKTHFDRENYLTWMAINILFDNYRKANTDYLLYSPLNSNKWYFMPWNFDDAWSFDENRAKWQRGISAYWDNVLHKRFFKEAENIDALNDKIEKISKIVNKERTKVFLDSYYDVLLSNITKLPDFKYLPVTLETYKRQYEELAELTEINRLYYYELLENPMPFNLNEPHYRENKYIFTWEESFDLQGDDLYYDFELSKDKTFSTPIKTVKDIKNSRWEVENLEKGTYYWRVTVRDSKGNYQTAHRIFRDEYGDRYYGIKQFVLDNKKELLAFEDTHPKEIEESEDEIIVIRDNSPSGELKIIDKEQEQVTTEKETEKPKGLKKPYKTYRLKAGETLYSVSMRFYGTKKKIEEIKKLNNIKDENNLSIGHVLKLPHK